MEAVNDSGSFSDISCPRLLARLHHNRFHGTLRVTQSAMVKLLYFQQGGIAMASSNDPKDHLAPILIRAGRLKSEQLDLARKSAPPGTSLARVLVQMGFLTSGELFAGARQQLRQIVGSLLPLTEAHYSIEKDHFPREITSLNVDTREMLLELVRDFTERTLILSEVGAPDTRYAPIPSLAEAVAALKLPKSWKEHAGRFATPLTIHEFGQAAGLDDFSASKVVYGLHLMELVERQRQERRDVEPEPVPVTVSVQAAMPVETSAAPRAEIKAESIAPAPETEEAESVRDRMPTPLAAPAEEPAEPVVPAATAETPREAIRLRFEGSLRPVTPPRSRSSGPWGILSILAGLSLLAVAFYWFVFLKEPSSMGPSSPVTSTEQATAAEPVPPPAAGTEAPSEEAPAAPAETAATAPSPGPAPSEPQPEPTRPSAPPAPSEAASTEPSFSAATRFLEARSRLDAGDFRGAARSWLKVVRSETERGYTLQIAIACQEDTLRKAAEGTHGSSSFFLVPFSLGERDCFRLCWGAYGTLEEAQAAKPTLPGFFLDGGGSPVVVSLGKLFTKDGR